MRIMRSLEVVFGLALLGTPSPAGAQAASSSPRAAAPGGPAHPLNAAAKERREQAKERRDEAKEHRDEAKERREEAKEKREALRDGGKAEHEGKHDGDEWREKRAERRHAHIEELRRRWGDSLAQPAVRAELKTHARRIARLNHMRRLAEEANKPKLVERIDKLIEKEQARHTKHMETLKSQPSALGGAK